MERTFYINCFLAAVLLAACNESAPSEAVAPKPPAKPVVIGANFATTNLAYQLAGDDLNVIYPIPSEIEPGEWADAAKISALEAGVVKLGEKCLLLASGGDLEIPWFSQLAGKATHIAEFPFRSAELNPANTSALINEIAASLKTFAPDSAEQIESRRVELQEGGLRDFVSRWETLAGMEFSAGVLSLDPAIIEFLKSLPIEVALTTRDELQDAEFLLLANSPDAEFAALLEEKGIQPILINPSRKLSSDSDVILTLKQNIENLESLPWAAKKPLGAYEGNILPILERYCIDCHDSDNEEGEVNFENFLTTKEAESNPDFWDRVHAQLDLGTMPPPEKKKQLSTEEHATVMAWIGDLGDRWDRAEFGKDPGRTTIRRLNKNEYNYTVRDLFDLAIRPGAHFPDDGGGEAGFDNNADGLFLGPLLMENYVESAGVVAQAVFANSTSRNKFLFARPGPGLNEQEAARKVFTYWASLCYRKPARPGEIDNLVKIFASQRKKKGSYEEAMQVALVAILISPEFLYRSEIDKKKPGHYRISPFEVANRLSYFLWSSMPDRELFKLAKEGELWKFEVIEEQVLRMLKDKRSKALSMHFAGQWFGWEKLRGEANPDPARYPQFTMPLRIAMYRESSAYFNHLLETNSSIYDLIDSDYAFLNQTLASHYGIPGVTGPEIRRVALQTRNRGGVLGMGSVLVATSLPLRSSPAARGDYVLTEILGTPPPEPPMNVEQLPEDSQEVAKTFREALEQHRDNESCRSCHQVIDPIGFGMENFDAIGRWRTTQNNLPIDATGVMPDGSKITSPADVKAVLMRDKELFARTFVSKMLSYALGRELTPYDRPIIANLTREVVESDGQIHSAVVAIAKSYPFLSRRNENYQPVPLEPEP